MVSSFRTLIHFLECIGKETQEEWLVDFYPLNVMMPGMLLAIYHKE
ncbi:MAG: hypothetical protein HGA97_09230 [Chlorobiaceae bacterium]|nr:hypothetical protein [Chlorobiaceae bacterium]